ncbi:MAG: redoxin domain-containing protein [Clostridiales bacterium]|nr:redoxin domain-containing protein [Clostridiales bacterium]
MRDTPIQVGERFGNFSYDTAWEQGKPLDALLETGKLLLIFSRYIGCHPCLMELIDLAALYPKIRQRGGELLVVMQSAPETVREVLKPGLIYKTAQGEPAVFGREQLPFDLACDPTCAIYLEYDIPAAKNKLELFSPASLLKARRAEKMGLSHGKYEGNELQLPATFLLKKEGEVAHAHYGKAFADYLNEEALLALLDR